MSDGRLERQQLLRILREEGMEMLASTLRPAFALRAVATPSLAAGQSRFGGRPELVEGADWPVGSTGLLTFVAQVDLSRWGGAALGLPAHGLLSVFLDTMNQPPRATAPDVAVRWLDAARVTQVPAERELECDELDAYALECTPTWTVRMGTPSPANAARWLATLIRVDPRTSPTGLLGGYAYPLQSSMESECAELVPSVRAEDWSLLLQLDTGVIPGIAWGSGSGRLYVWAPTEEMRRGEFQNAVSFIQDS